MSSAYWWKKTKLLIDWPGFMTFAISELNRTKRSAPRTLLRYLVSMVVLGDNGESIWTKDELSDRCDLIQTMTLHDRPRYVQVWEEVWSRVSNPFLLVFLSMICAHTSFHLVKYPNYEQPVPCVLSFWTSSRFVLCKSPATCLQNFFYWLENREVHGDFGLYHSLMGCRQ